MIAKLTGIVDSFSHEGLVLEVQGVGYGLLASSRTLSGLVSGQKLVLVVETRITEEKIQLIGFASHSERELFRQLQTVQGVGVRLALSILGAISPQDLASAILSGDQAMLRRISGVGPKLAGRLVNELKDKFGVADFAMTNSENALDSITTASGANSANASNGSSSTNLANPASLSAAAISALVNLGYGRSQAFNTVTTIERRLGAAADLETVIRQSLAELSGERNAKSAGTAW